ncbi:MAG: SUF system NifU family Fe-S cluster assembly protein [Treponema sp.]|nr:SUF system NifU family Fe-S cluster assembly protein [Treponema sp.]
MDTRELYQEILNEHNIRPLHKRRMTAPSLSRDGVNPSCGDNITLNLAVDETGVITDASFTGSGCAISQASADMMIDLILGKNTAEALRLADIFTRMIQGSAHDAELEALDEAAALQDIARMPARVKCALLSWRTMQELLAAGKTAGTGSAPHCVPTQD